MPYLILRCSISLIQGKVGCIAVTTNPLNLSILTVAKFVSCSLRMPITSWPPSYSETQVRRCHVHPHFHNCRDRQTGTERVTCWSQKLLLEEKRIISTYSHTTFEQAEDSHVLPLLRARDPSFVNSLVAITEATD